MGLKARDKGGADFTPPPEGLIPARCVQVVELGTILSKYYNTWSHKVMIGFELCPPNDERIPEGDRAGQRFIVWQRYTVSLSKKANLRKDLQSWRSKPFTEQELEGFELSKLLDVPCQLQMRNEEDEKGRTWPRIDAIVSAANVKVPDREHDLVSFELEDPDMEVFASFGENLQDTIKGSVEWQLKEGNGDPRGEPVAAGKANPLDPTDGKAGEYDADDVPF